MKSGSGAGAAAGQEQVATAPFSNPSNAKRSHMLGAQASPPAAQPVNDSRSSFWSFSELETPKVKQVNDPGFSAEVSHSDRAGGDACSPSRDVHSELGFVTKVNL